MPWLCIGCSRINAEGQKQCPDCLCPQTAVACRCGFIFADYDEYVAHRKAGCIDVGILTELRKRGEHHG